MREVDRKRKVTDIKIEIDSNTIILGDSNTPLTSIDHPVRKVSNNSGIIQQLNQMDLKDTHRVLHPKAAGIHSFF